MDYKASGVDVELGDQFVDWIQKSSTSPSPHQRNILSGVGGFAALFRLDVEKYRKPILVSSTDGVGTKVKLAAISGRLDGIGQDLVGMCVNDLITCGAEPLFFLDYYATSRLKMDSAKSFLEGLRKACHDSGCALIGGETAEMPGIYSDDDFDVAGFAVGVVEEDQVLGPSRVQFGDRLLGISSSGFHSNGYSLLRRLFEHDLDTWIQQLMKPTALYTQLSRKLTESRLVQAMAHITGSGMENIPRSLPKGSFVKLKTWDFSLPYLEVRKRSGLNSVEMLKTFNCGVGFVCVVRVSDFERARDLAQNLGFVSFDLGEVERGKDPLMDPWVDYSLWEKA